MSGKDGAFSYGIHIMISEAHLVYNIHNRLWIKENIFWDKHCPNLYDSTETKAASSLETALLFFSCDAENLDLCLLDKKLIACEDNIMQKAEIINLIREKKDKKRFFVSAK